MMPSRFLIILLGTLIVAGCQVNPPRPLQSPFVPTVNPRPMAAKSSASGNEYDIVAVAATNRPDWPSCQYAPIPKRVHIQLSTDGGSNYTRYLAYGVPVVDGVVSYRYSMPWWDESIITEHARVRLTDMAGEQMGASMNEFTIAGLFWHRPASGDILTHGANLELEWVQAGAGDSVNLGWLTPTEEFTVITTFTNVVAGTNIINWRVTGVPYPRSQIKLVIQSVSHPICWGETGVLSSQ